jgi:VWFA-related protein
VRRAATRTTLAILLGAGALLPAQETPTFRSDAQVVLLDMVARDRKGQPVADLRADEVQVYEDGTRCEITSFRLVRGPGRDGMAPGSTTAAPAATVAEAATPSRANLVILVFDNLPVANASLARQGALDLLSRDFPANTWFAVFKIDRSMRQLQAFTSDPARLASAVDFATMGDDARRAGTTGSLQTLTIAPSTTSEVASPTRPDLPPIPQLAGIGDRVQAGLQELASRQLALDSLYGLLALARSLEPVRGRKSIVYFAAGSEVPDSVTVAYDTTVSEANRANVTIHTVDARGLSATRPGGRSAFDEILGGLSVQGGSGAPSQGGRAVIPGATRSAAASTESGDPGGGPISAPGGLENPLSGSFLQHIANDTGGLAIADTNDLGRGLGRVVEELGLYYEVVYVPPNPVPDGRFRRIEAKVSRPGVRVRTRSGYFATPAAAPGLLAYEMPLLAALGARAPSHDFAHHAGVLHFGPKGREREALFLARVPLSDVRIAADQARGVYRGHLALLGLLKDEAGRPVARITHDWPIEGPLAGQERARRASAIFRQALTLPPGRYTLETAVQDRETGALSVERSAFVVDEAPPGGLALGSLSVVRRAEPAGAGTSDDPLRVAGVSIQPELGTPVLPRSTREIPLFLLVYPTLAAGGAELRLELLRDGQPVAQARPPLPAPEPDGRIAWVGGLPARSLAPGRYEVVATVRAGDESAEERTAFEIGAGAAADATASGPPPVPAELVPVLEQAARYVLEYEHALHDIAAEESYTQWALRQPTGTGGLSLSCTAGACRRTTRADVVFVRLGGAIPWGTFRDVFEVDGQKVRDREGRLEALFSASSPATVVQRARAILNESARYNIGPAVRNINFPTLSLTFLLPINQRRFAWKRGGTRRFGTVEVLEVRFEEVERPTLVDQDGQGDLPAKGRFWIDPARGTVLRSEAEFRFEPARARAYVATQYRAEPKLAMWVPSEMREEYEDLPAASTPVFRSPSEATARYSDFRKFTVTIEDVTATVPEGPGREKPEP